MAVPKVAAIHDLSGLGKCSLTAAIPILSVCGVQAVPMPTSVLSNQTGFESYAGADLTEYMPVIAGEWKKRNLELQGIFTGYLGGAAQVDWVAGFVDEFRREDTLVLIDPVMGDGGEFYKGFGEELRLSMIRLCSKADVITPNLTEALLLLGHDPAQGKDEFDLERVRGFAKELAKLGPQTVIITGIQREQKIWNIGYSAQEDHFFEVNTRKFGGGYSGTGDILSSVICGCMVKGHSAETALNKAAKLLEESIREAVEDGTDPCEGVAFENHLGLLL